MPRRRWSTGRARAGAARPHPRCGPRLEATIDELNAAVAAILRVAGLTPGEAGGSAAGGRAAAEIPGEQTRRHLRRARHRLLLSLDVIDGMTLAETEEIFAYWAHTAGASDGPDDRAHARLEPRGTPAGAPRSKKSPPPHRPASPWRGAETSACRRPRPRHAARQKPGPGVEIARRNGTPATG